MMLKRAENKDIARIEDYYRFVADNTENIPIRNGEGNIFQRLHRAVSGWEGFGQIFDFDHITLREFPAEHSCPAGKFLVSYFLMASREVCLPP